MVEQQSLKQILEASRTTVEEANARLNSLPARSERRQSMLPQTFTEASQYVQTKEDEKKKREAKKDKQKQKGSVQSTDIVPGLMPGPPDSSPFWIVTEGYFRDVTKEDLAEILSPFANPLEDPVFLIPPMGRPYSLNEDDEPSKRPSFEHHRTIARPTLHQSLLKDRVSELKAQAAAESPVPHKSEETPNAEQAAFDDTQRKSRRLVARAVKEAEAKKSEDEHGLSGVDCEGANADFLLQRCSESELALVTGEVLALQNMPEAVLEQECGLQESDWKEWLASTEADREAEEEAAAVSLPEDARRKLFSWLAKQAVSMLQQHTDGANGLQSPAIAALGDELPSECLLANGKELAGDHDTEMARTDGPSTEGGDAAGQSAEFQSAELAERPAGSSAVAAAGGKEKAASVDPTSSVPVVSSSLTGIRPETAATFTSWKDWQAALAEHQPPLPINAAEDEYMHPYTDLMLQQGPTQYVLRPEPDTRHVASMSGIATPSAVTPSASADDGSAFTAHPADAGADSAATPRPAGGGFLPTPSQLGGVSTADHSLETPSMQPLLVKAESSAGLSALGDTSERVVSGSLAGPSSAPAGGGGRVPLARQRSQVNYSLMAGNSGRKTEAGKGAGAARKAKGSERHEPRHKGQTAAAVQNAVAAGDPEGSLDDQWQQLGQGADVLATAPDDEVLAEILALQSELMQQVAVNRGRLGLVLERLLPDIERQKEATAREEEDIEFVKTYFAKLRAAKRGAKREKREAAARDALAEAQANLQQSPRPAIGRSRASADRGTPGQVELVDVLACRKEDEEALCAVCSGGLSAAPNYIVFCERCDVAVHQNCYGIAEIPRGEWLCWPCREHEEAELRAGRSQHQIRPPRWEAVDHRRHLEGGSLAAECALCPVRCGAFRRTVDTGDWVHQVCALWVPDLKVRAGAGAEAVEGVASIKPERWGVPCTLCGSSRGVVLRCNAGHCTLPFHALCARNAGNYLAIRAGPGKNQLSYRAYCAQHSDSQRRKDLDSSLAGAEGAPQRKADAKRREKEEAAAAAALRSLAAREAQQATLLAARLELESLRVLLERIGRRERIKHQVVRATLELYRARAANPVAGLAAAAGADAAAPLPVRAALRQQLAIPAAASAPTAATTPEPPDTAAASSAADGGKAEQPALEASASVLEETPSTPEDEPMLVEGEPHPAAEPALLGGAERPADGSDAGAAAAAGEGTSAAGTADAQTAGALAEASEAQQPGEAAAATAEAAVAESGKVEQEEEAGAVEAEGPEEVQKTPSRTPSPAKKPPLSKRKRDSDPVPASNNTSRSKAQAKKAKGGAGRDDTGQEAGADAAPPGTRLRLRQSGSSAQLDRQCLMTSSEAAASNSKLPKGLKYVPMQTLRKSSRPSNSQSRH